MFERWLASLIPVHEAKTEAERAAVYRLRYEVYLEELGKTEETADHENRRLRDPEDDDPDTVILYAGSAEKPTGTARLQVWRPGRIPPRDAEMLSTHLFAGIENLTTGISGRLIARNDARGSLMVPALIFAGYRTFVEHGGQMNFAWCAPGLVHSYRRLGYRTYTSRLIHYDDGVRVPLVAVPSDLSWFERMHSPLTPFVRQSFGPGKRPVLDLTPFQGLFDVAHQAVEADPEIVCHALAQELQHAEAGTVPLLDKLTERSIQHLAKEGFLMEVDQGDLVTREGLVEREIYVVLEGSFALENDGRTLRVATPGDVMGWVSFFLDSGRRVVSIRALSQGRLFVLRRKFLDDLEKSDPALAYRLLFNLSRVMASQMSGLIQQHHP